jgi:ABC-type oligopeptide transport system substrate-binding subunit
MRFAPLALAVVVALAACDVRPGGNVGQTPAARQALQRGLGAEPGTLDPQLAADNAALTVVADLYEGLTTEANDGSIVAGCAGSWTVDDGGQEYVFRLRRGLRWSNGDALTADHFVAGLRHALDASTAAPNASLLEDIAQIEAPAADTVRLRLRRPVTYLPALLALPVAAPRHPRASALEPVPGNGAYRLVRRLPGQRIELERNPYYWNAAGVAIDHVIHVAIADLATEVNLYRSGELDLTSEVPNTMLRSLQETLPDELQLAPYLSVYSYAVNMARLPNRSARLALAMAVDRGSITREVTGAGERPALGWVPDGIAGYAPARFKWSGLDRSQAVTEARRLWDIARQSGTAPTHIRLCTDASANHRRTAIAAADFWRTALGIETEIVELEWNVYLDTREQPGDCDLVRLGWSADFADPEAFAMVFESGHPQNTLGYSSAAYDALIANSRAASRAPERMSRLAQAEAQLLADTPVIPLFFRVSKRLVKPYVEGATPNPLGHLASRHLRIVVPEKKGAGGP